MKKILSLIIAIVMIMTAFAGCSSNEEEQEPQSLALVIANRENFPKLSLNTDSIYSKIYDACYSFGKVTAVVSDGSPFLAGDYTINKPDVNVDKAKKKQLAKNNTQAIITQLSTAYAKEPEGDTLKAISNAADSLSSSSENKTLLVFDNCLSTAGILNFANQNIIEADTDTIVEQLEQMNAVPRVEGMDIIITGLGQTAGKQKPLPDSYKAKLEELYTAILKRGGASSITINREPIPSEENNDVALPKCSVVTVVEDELDLSSAIPEVVKLDDEKISFVADTADFINEKKVQEALKPISKVLIENEDIKILVVGSTATAGSIEGCKQLSEERADKVKAELIKFGVSAKNIRTIGAGQSSTPLRVNDVINGKLIENEAKKNRAVYIIDSSSDLAEYFG